MKIAMVFMLAGVGYLFVALCVSGGLRAGSTEGLADIGNAAVLSVAVTGVAVAAGLRAK